MDIRLVTVDPDTGQVTLAIEPSTVDGFDELVQIVILSLLNVPGQDVLDPDLGGGLPSLIGINIDQTDANAIFGEVAQLVRQSQIQILDQQIGLDVPPAGKLKDLVVLSIIEGNEADEIFVKIRIINEAGRQIDIVV